MAETQEATIQLLQETGALLEGHFVLTSNRHSDKYINKDAVTMWPDSVNRLCALIGRQYWQRDIQVVAAPAVGGIPLGQWTAYHLGRIAQTKVMSVYAEHVDERVDKATNDSLLIEGFAALTDLWGNIVENSKDSFSFKLSPGDELIVRRNRFEFKRGYDKVLAGKRVLVVEDIVTTGGSIAKVIEAVHECGGEVVGAYVLANRGGVTSEDIDSELSALAEVTFESWAENDCPLCAAGVPVNTDVGKGKLFLAQKG